MWLIATYQPAALFTLKVGTATATGGKSLLVPTPFALRTALLDVALRVEGVTKGEEAFEALRGLDLALRPPAFSVVTNLFAKILKPTRSDKDRDEAMTPTIAFREYVHHAGNLELAFGGKATTLERLTHWLPHLSYLGRRGGFLQFLPPLDRRAGDSCPNDFTRLTQAASQEDAFPLGVLQMLDDWGPTLTYDKLNVYSDASIRRPGSGMDRIRYGVVLPYQFQGAGRGFTLYRRIE